MLEARPTRILPFGLEPPNDFFANRWGKCGIAKSRGTLTHWKGGSGVDEAQYRAVASPLSRSEEAPYPRPPYAWYVLAVLTLVYLFAYMDRQILSLLVAPVRRDLRISDTQMSLLIGIAFAAFYATFGIPIGRVVDSRSRRGLIAVGFFLWSLFAMGCGLAHNFLQLATMRVGVGVGEAVLGPSAYSLISDYFPPHRRGIAQGIYSMGIPLGGGVALVLGGLLTNWASRHGELALLLVGRVHSWQLVFLVIGVAGMLLAPIMGTVSEPLRRGIVAGSKKVPFRQVFRYLKTHWKTYGCHNLGISLILVCGYASSAWIPTFFIRHHHWSTSKTGLILGNLMVVFGCVGTFSSGWIANRLFVTGRRDACLFVGFLIAVLWLPMLIAMLLAPTATGALILYIPVTFLAPSVNGIGPAALMQVTPQRMRGQAGAIYVFLVNLIGLGLGPTGVALFTDHLFHNDGMVGYSLMIVAAMTLPMAAVLLWRGRYHFLHTLDVAAHWSETKVT